MKHQQDQRPRRSTSTWLARVAAIALNPTGTRVPVDAIARAETGLALAFVTRVVA